MGPGTGDLPGMWADVTVFDPATIADKATYENPYQYVMGVQYVIVNGKLMLDGGKHTGRRGDNRPSHAGRPVGLLLLLQLSR